jgi:serine/threonine protein kinase
MNRANQATLYPATKREVTATGSVSDDPRLVAALEDYLSRLNAGNPPDRDAFLSANREIADELADCLDGLDFIHTAASRISSSDPANGESDSSRPPAQLGDYRLLKEVGRGGMGIVYEAEQVSLGRRVALKVLPFAASIDPRQRQRFQVEAQAAAHLHHPHIVPIYSVGCDRGVHFYAMQFIEGNNLSTLIQDLANRLDEIDKPAAAAKVGRRRFEASSTVEFSPGNAAPVAPEAGSGEWVTTGSGVTPPRGRAFFRTVARLGAQAAEALDHAHGLGVLHRDIKPSNLIVDPRGNLWVTDFGLARFEEDAGLTRTGDLLGTLRYMSPEQTQADLVVVDHRTDVYSLGATLYELATLRPVFASRDRNELLRQIASEDPIAPRKINPEMPRDLETIILKAMSKEPRERYSSAQELADDLRRMLADEPILARRPSYTERTARWARRHRPALAFTAGLAVCSLAIAAALLWHDHRRTQAHLDELTVTRKRELANLRTTMAHVHNYTKAVMSRLSQADAEVDSGILKLYDQGREFYENVVRDSGNDPEMRETKSEALEQIGYFRMYFGDFPRSEAAFKEAVQLRDALVWDNPGSSDRYKALAAALKAMGELQMRAHGSKQAESYYARSLEAQKLLVRRHPEVPKYLATLIESQIQWAHHLEGAKRGPDAAKIREEVDAEYDEEAKLVASGKLPKSAVLDAYYNLAMGLDEISRYDASWCHEVHQAYEQALIVAPNDATALNNVAWSYAKNPKATCDQALRAVELAQRAVDIDPKKRESWNTLGAAHYRAKEWKLAHAALQKSMDLNDVNEGGDAYDFFLKAMTFHGEHKSAEAMKWYAKAGRAIQGRIASQVDLLRLAKEADELLGQPAGTKSTLGSTQSQTSLPQVGPTLLIDRTPTNSTPAPRQFVCPLTGVLFTPG